MAIDFAAGGAFAYNPGCLAISVITLAALADSWSWRKAAAYSVAGYVAGSWAIHHSKTAPWKPGLATGLTRPLKPAGFYVAGAAARTTGGAGETSKP